MRPECWACGPMYAEWQAVVVAVIVGVEAAAYVVLASTVAFLCLSGCLGVLRRVWS